MRHPFQRANAPKGSLRNICGILLEPKIAGNSRRGRCFDGSAVNRFKLAKVVDRRVAAAACAQT
jgi:hypothetical protein